MASVGGAAIASVRPPAKRVEVEQQWYGGRDRNEPAAAFVQGASLNL